MNTRHIAAVAVLLAAAPVANAVIINVPGDEPTIQAGIDAAVDGDEVVVAPGTYFEAIDFLNKAITVRSSGGAAVTTIDGGGAVRLEQVGLERSSLLVYGDGVAGLLDNTQPRCIGQYDPPPERTGCVDRIPNP